jgi:polyisoprenyl-phosphate glycosyltransferase
MSNNVISIIVPVYNEEHSVEQTVNRIKKTMQSSASYEILAVNDSSKDNSGTILDSLTGITVIHHHHNKGYSASLKTGIRRAKGNYIVITDADGTYPVEDIPKLLEHIGKFDMVIGGRTGKNVYVPLARKPAKWFLGKLANYIAGRRIPDINSGLRVFRKDLALEFWKLLPERFSFTITMTMASITNGYDVKFIPINYYKRKGKSTIHPIKDFIGFNKILLKMMLFFRPLKIFIPLSVATFLTGLLIFALGFIYFDKFLDITLVVVSLSAVQFFILGLLAELMVRTKR